MAPLTKYTVKRGRKISYRTDDFDRAFDDFLFCFDVPRVRADLGDDLASTYDMVKRLVHQSGDFKWGKAKIILNK